MKASQLQSGENARILSITEGPHARRLAEMGCVPGSTIKMAYAAPAGDPIAFEMDGNLLGLRKEEADYLEVEMM
ncbi:MAG: ferrous iron transport protein A [Bacteroidetes bacterium]|nr:ferrous iron transport protein A [Bacteroidota bacterium]